MSIIGFIRGMYRDWLTPREKRAILQNSAPEKLARPDWERSLKDPTGFYKECFRYFHQRLPKEITDHRAYFSSEGRGFGEDSMHVMWYMLFQEFKPTNFLEIGVFRGQVASLAALLSRLNKIDCDVTGISPFSPAGDRVSKYEKNVDYLPDTYLNFEQFSLPCPNLFKAYSTDDNAVALIRSKKWDMIYIDGNHDYEVVIKDWEVCSQSLKVGGIVVLDDSGLSTRYQPPVFTTGGHPGPSQLAKEIDHSRFRELLQVGHNRVFQKLS